MESKRVKFEEEVATEVEDDVVIIEPSAAKKEEAVPKLDTLLRIYKLLHRLFLRLDESRTTGDVSRQLELAVKHVLPEVDLKPIGMDVLVSNIGKSIFTREKLEKQVDYNGYEVYFPLEFCNPVNMNICLTELNLLSLENIGLECSGRRKKINQVASYLTAMKAFIEAFVVVHMNEEWDCDTEQDAQEEDEDDSTEDDSDEDH